MKEKILESLILKLEVGGAILVSFLAIINPDQELKVVGWSIIGAVLGGFLGVYFYKPPAFKDWILRWLVNIIAGVVVGLVITAKVQPKHTDIPLGWLAMFVSFVAGPATVAAIPIGIPWLKQVGAPWAKKKLLGWLTKDQEKNEK